MWLDNKPTEVHATPDSVKTDYAILKELLPIPLGIDHLKPETLQENKILDKMNLLNVGEITDITLEDDQIKIKDAHITNPTIQTLYDNGELPYYSFVSNMFTSPCQSGQADAVEQYSVIGRVDFVEKGACEACRTGITAHASDSKYNAKAIIGDDNVAEDSSNSGDNSGDGNEDGEPTMADVLKAIKGLADTLVTIKGALKVQEVPAGDNGQQANPQQQAAASNSEEENNEEEEEEGGTPAAASDAEKRIAKLEKQMKEQNATAAKAEAMGIVSKFQKEGKVLPKDLDDHVAMAMATPEQYKKAMENAKPVVDMDRHSSGNANAGDAGATITDEDGNEIDLDKTVEEIDAVIKPGGE